MTYPGSLSSNSAFIALRNRVEMLERRAAAALSLAAAANTVAVAGATTSAKRFRIGVVSIPLTLLGGTVVASVKWSTPITDNRGVPVDSYNIDASCSAMPTTALVPTISGQSSVGVTVTFTAPVLLAANTIVVILGIASAATS